MAHQRTSQWPDWPDPAGDSVAGEIPSHMLLSLSHGVHYVHPVNGVWLTSSGRAPALRTTTAFRPAAAWCSAC